MKLSAPAIALVAWLGLVADAQIWGLEVSSTVIDLGEVSSQCVELPFSIRAKSSYGCPLIDTTCGCIVIQRDRAQQDKDGWWNIPILRKFGIRSGRESHILHIK